MFLGLCLVIITGLSWIIAGAVMAQVVARRWNTYHYLTMGTLASAAVSLAFMPFMGETHSAFPAAGICLLMVLNGFVNLLGMEMIAKAMSLGPNALVWSMAQSALICPFIMGICLGSTPTFIRISGAILVVGGIIAAAFARNTNRNAAQSSGTGSRKWLLVTMCAFSLAGLSQCLMNLPSYFPPEAAGGGLWRGVFMSIGGALSMFMIMALSPEARRKKCPLRLIFLTATLPGLIPGLVQNTCFYRGLDLLAQAGAGSIGYPICTGICIAGFTIYTAIRLRERLTLVAVISTLLCLGGIVALSL